jgi:hypothetical protein
MELGLVSPVLVVGRKYLCVGNMVGAAEVVNAFGQDYPYGKDLLGI